MDAGFVIIAAAPLSRRLSPEQLRIIIATQSSTKGHGASAALQLAKSQAFSWKWKATLMPQMSITSSIAAILCLLVACGAVQSLTLIDENLLQLPTFTDQDASELNEDDFVIDPSANVEGK